jgi:tight adherence protein B
MTQLILGSLFLAVFLTVFLIGRMVFRDARKVDQRMRHFIAETPAQQRSMESDGIEDTRRRIVKTMIPRRFLRHIDIKLAQADMSMYGNEFLYMIAGIFIITFSIVALLSKSILMALALGMVVAYLPFYYVNRKANSRSRRFEAQFSDALTLVSNSLRVGYSFSTAIDLISKELRPPISTDFARLMRDLKLGADFDEALSAMGQRLQSQDFNLFLIAVQIQRQVGGNLTEVLDKLSATIRERDRVRGEIKTLTAQGKLSGIIIGALPVVVGLVIFVINPAYILLLFQSILGLGILGFTILLEIVGILLIRKVINIEG